jgi:hypothetical protein
MRVLIVFIFFLALTVFAFGYPRHAFLDLPTAVSVGDTGLTYLRLKIAGPSPSFRISRAINSRFDISAEITAQKLFSLELRALLLSDFGPLSAAVDLSFSGVRLLSRIFLGPVQLDWGRAFGPQSWKWGMLSISVEQRLSLLVELGSTEGKNSVIAGLRLFQAGGPLGGSFLFNGRGFELSLGGYF